MIPLTPRQLSCRVNRYHAAVAATPGIDPFCCRIEWLLPFHRAFTPTAPMVLWQQDDSFVLLARQQAADGAMLLTPLEALWGFACPLIGPDAPAMLVCEARQTLAALLLCGLPADGALARLIADSLRSTHAAALLEPTRRCVASLSGGIAGFMGRRSAAFRRNLNQALRRTREYHISFERISTVGRNRIGQVYRRVLAVERKSWKGMSGSGVDRPPMKTFYRLMLERIEPAGMLRLIIAVRDGEDIGYIYGARIAGHYRGLQFSFDQRYAGLSLGNVLQYRMLEWLCEEGCERYDLGAAMPYKYRWADTENRTQTMLLRPR